METSLKPLRTIKSEMCSSSNGRAHQYQIIKKSGKKTGTSKWRCIFCNHIVKSS
jgi:hypothetical protein